MANKRMEELKKKLREREKQINDPETWIYEYIREIRFQIDIKAEEEKKAIEDQREQLLKKLDQFEKECKENTKHLQKEKLEVIRGN